MTDAGGLGVDGRAWFDEDDRPGRRLAVHARAARGQVNLSFWDGDVCRATFRLPEAEVPRLVDALAAVLVATAELDPNAGPDPTADTATLQLLAEAAEGGPE